MNSERTLTQRELNRALLARQLLLERTATTVPRALERRTVVQATPMRVTIHLVTRRDFWPFALATRDARRRLWLSSRRGEFEERDMAEAAELLRPLLAEGPLKRTDIEQLVGKARASGVGLWIDLVRVPPSGTWARRRADLYGLAETWIGAPSMGVDEGVEDLVRRYLTAFGPASRTDLASYTGLPQATIAPALEGLRLRRFRDEAGEELLDVPRGPLPAADTPAPVRFLPTWDATLLVHARRTGILPEEHRPKIFTTKNPHSTPTFLVDGSVAGTWRYEKGRIALEPFGRLDRRAERELREEAERLAEFHA